MNDKIKAAAKSLYPGSADPGFDYRRNARDAFLSGASYALKESRVDELREVLREISKGQNGELKGEFIGRIKKLSIAALSKSDLFFNDKNLKDGKENRD